MIRKMRYFGQIKWTALLLVLLLAGCGVRSVSAKSGEKVPTALFDFTVGAAETLDSYPGVEILPGQKLVSMPLTVENTGTDPCPMFAGDFQIQWGEGDADFTTCLPALDEEMVPDSYQLEPGGSYTGRMLVTVPQDCTRLVVAYQEWNAKGEALASYFVEVPL